MCAIRVMFCVKVLDIIFVQKNLKFYAAFSLKYLLFVCFFYSKRLLFG